MIDQEIVPLRVVLRNFLNHIENLESQSCPEKSYEAEFQDLKIFSENVKSLKEYSCLEGEKEVNRKKNRYKDILPFDVSRVVLNEYTGIPGSDYINANFIKGASGSLAYIASQGPLPSTVNDFWRMVVQCEVQVIVMACNVEEAGKAKCEKYWVDGCEEKQFGMISVKLLKSSTVCPDFSVRTMRLKYTNGDSIEERTVCQLHYVAWPDHGVPTVVQPLLDMVRLVRDTQASETLPVLVHCSAGCGRTGTICAIDYVWGLLRTGKLTNDFSLLRLIREMRKQRIAMVQTKEQYVLVHQAVRELFREQLCMIDSHPYENVDPNGLLIIKEEENTYDTIDYAPNNYLEDKRDNKEKESIPPPLPSKRNVSKFPSKYEKEIENLTAQQRSMKSNIRNIAPLYTAKEKKKVNNKEYFNGSDKINKRTNDKQIKLDANKPILSKGILSVPQLESLPKCKTSVKRSKSLKVVRNCEKSSLSFCQSNLSENKRRSSLESNFDEHIIDADRNVKIKPKNEVEPLSEQKKCVPQLVSKYDILKSQDHQTFVRSLTCLDLRPKMVFSHTNSVVSSLEDSLTKQRVKLLRSNTQINVLKKGGSYFQSKSGNLASPVVDSMAGLKVDSTHNNYSFIGNKKMNQSSLNKSSNKNLRLGPKPLGSSVLPAKQQVFLKTAGGENSILKSSDKPRNPPFQILDGMRYLKEAPKPRSSSTGRSEKMKNLSLEETYENFSPDRNLKPSTKQDKFSSSSFKMIHSNSLVDNVKQLALSSDEPKYTSRTNQLKLLKPPKKLQISKPVSSSASKANDFSSGMQNPFSQKKYREDFSRVHHSNSGHEDFLSITNHLMEEYPTISDLKSSPSFNDCFTDESNDQEPGVSLWMERDNPRIQTNFNKPPYSSAYIMNRPPKGQSLLPNTPDDSKEVQRRLTGDLVVMDNYEHLNSIPSAGFQEPSFNKESMPALQSDINYHLQNRKNIHHYNGSLHSSRHPVPNAQLGPDPSSMANRAMPKNPLIQPKIIDAPSGTQDVYYSSEFHRSYCNCFHSAPGVDLDQVAASITKNDENLMKATLEELQVRQTKLLMTPKERCPPKGDPNAGSSGDKKKQQQYL